MELKLKKECVKFVMDKINAKRSHYDIYQDFNWYGLDDLTENRAIETLDYYLKNFVDLENGEGLYDLSSDLKWLIVKKFQLFYSISLIDLEAIFKEVWKQLNEIYLKEADYQNSKSIYSDFVNSELNVEDAYETFINDLE